MDVKERTIKYFSENVLSKIFDGANVVLSAHGNSLRSILVYLKELNLGRKLKTEEVMKIEAPLSLPIFIVFDKKTREIKEY
ncbi:MAG: hypothetical protein PHP14_03845 [Candidatus Pacebacteria bacterium]|nr:hypothetical protein [Candidatus Paceibacterota bacterium]